jgi:hypothetical protein
MNHRVPHKNDDCTNYNGGDTVGKKLRKQVLIFKLLLSIQMYKCATQES